MKPVVCIYCEGNDTKVAVLSKEKDSIRVLKVADFDVLHPKAMEAEAYAGLSIDGGMNDISIGDLDRDSQLPDLSVSNEGLFNAALTGIKLSDCEFIPAITEPALHYHVYEGNENTNPAKLTQTIAEEIQKTKNITVSKDHLGIVELAGGSYLSAFADGDIACINMINSLAQFNGRRFYKIPTVKSAEVSLANYVAKRKKFFPDDYSLIVYIGKEYSKLIFLQGKKLKHLGTTLDVGTLNLHTYDVYFSKILLEMENGGVPRLDNVILCGEDESENLILSFYGTFPEANVSRVDFDGIDVTAIDDIYREKISSFSVPVAVATEYFDEQEKKFSGINLLPRYVREDQKFFQFAWHSYILLVLIFAVTFGLTYLIMSNQKEIRRLDSDIEKNRDIQAENQQIMDQINGFENKIANFGSTQAILDSASKGAEVWGRVNEDIASFVGAHKGMWITSLTSEANGDVVLTGYGLTRNVLTEFANSYESALLKNVIYESLRKKSTYKFTMTFNMNKLPGNENEPKN